MKFKKPSQRNIQSIPSRRRFISTCAACGACMAMSPLSSIVMEPDVSNSSIISTAKKKMRIRIIYSLHDLVQPVPDWPNLGFDFQPHIEDINAALIKALPSFEFISTMATGQEDAEKILSQDKSQGMDGYIVFQMNCWNRVVQTIAKSEKPVLYVDFKYAGSGGFLTYTSDFILTNQPNVGFVSSPRIEDLIAAVKCFEILANKNGSIEDFVAATVIARKKSTKKSGELTFAPDQLQTLSTDETLRRMKESKIVALRDSTSRFDNPVMGIPVEYASFAELNYLWENADPHEARAIAERWKAKATKVIGPRDNIIQDSAAMYLAMKAILKNHNANAITVNCLGGFYSNQIHAYPCLGFMELNNEGLIGACECDIDSTSTMLAINSMTEGRPGFISDPVVDTSKNQVIYAHCMSPTKAFGPKGPESPFEILTHSEDRQGACNRALLPIGYLTTTLRFGRNLNEIVMHQGVTVENDPDDRACRTKLCVEPIGDLEKVFYTGQWGGGRFGWHRVTFYGDLKEQVYALANAVGWKVIEEA